MSLVGLEKDRTCPTEGRVSMAPGPRCAPLVAASRPALDSGERFRFR